jgi:CRP-like cAMP-binding protein
VRNTRAKRGKSKRGRELPKVGIGETSTTGFRCRAKCGYAKVPDTEQLLARLWSRMALSVPDQRALLAAALPARSAEKGECLIEAGARIRSLFILRSGMACAVRTLSDGSQQIVAVFLAKDTLNPVELTFGRSLTSAYVLTPAVIIPVPLPQLYRLAIDRPAIGRALWLETATQAAIQQEWIVGLGRRTAQTRLAHFLCEVSYRLKLSERSDLDAFEFPLTQSELADVLGLSTVHVNRVLQALRGRGLIELGRNRLMIQNKTGLYEVGEFDPGYLQGTQLADQGVS